MVTTQIRVSGLKEITEGFMLAPEVYAVENEKAMVIATHIAEAEIKALTPRKTGRLFSSWERRTVGAGFATIGQVGDSVVYADVIEKGGYERIIGAKGNALMIPMTGAGAPVFGGGKLSGAARSGAQVAFFKKVRHPATTGKHMAARGLEAARPAIQAEFMKAAQRTFQQVLGRLRGVAGV